MTIDKKNDKLINEVFLKAQKVFLDNPTNKKAKNLFIEAFVKKILSEDQNEFDLLSIGKDKIQDDLKKSDVEQKTVLDPKFGMKAAICFESLPLFQLEIIDLIESDGLTDETKKILGFDKNYQPFLKQKGQVDTGTPGANKKIGARQAKYAGSYKDLRIATKTGSRNPEQGPRKVVAYNLSDEDKTIINNKVSKTWIPFVKSKMANAISSNNFKGTISATGAGELEFCARMLYACTKGMKTSLEISSKIQMNGGITKDLAEAQETFLLNLDNGKYRNTIADRCESILEVYLTLVAQQVLKPILKYANIGDYAYEGVHKAINKLIGIDEGSEKKSDEEPEKMPEGKYDFDNANIGAWTYRVARNYAIDKLRAEETDYVFDNSKAAEFTYAASYPFKFYSKIPKKQAIGLFDKEKSKEITVKSTGEVKFLYVYNNREDLFHDLQIANGIYYDATEKDTETKNGEETRGRKATYQRNNPLFYKNVSDVMRGNFMTSIQKYLPPQEEIETPKKLEKKYIDRVEKKEAELMATNIINNNKNRLLAISKEIIEKILQEKFKMKYGQERIKPFLSYNKELASIILLRLFNYGIYKFVENETRKEKKERLKSDPTGERLKPKGSYEWMTAPLVHLDDFILSLQDVNYLGQDLPQTVTNKQGKINMPIRQFIQLLKRVTLGSGTAGKGNELEKYFKSGNEDSEEFKKLVSTEGFLLQNPEYLRRVYSLLIKLPPGTELGTSDQKKIDENIKNLNNLINELKNEFEKFNKNLIKNITII